MADKQKDSKIMSMLERRGILKKADSDSSDSTFDSLGYDSNIKPLFDIPEEEAVTVKSAPKHPVPGMPTPIFPTDKPADTADDLSETVEVPKPKPEPVMQEVATKPTEAAAAFPPPSSSMFGEPPPPPTPSPAPPQPEAPKAASSGFGGLNIFRGNNSDDQSLPSARDGEPQPDNYTTRYLNINELYDALALRSKKTDTIYLIEEYLHTLPSSLPESQRREIVAKLIESSGFDFDLLMGDGVLRVKMLKEYAARFARHTDDYIAARQAEIDELDQQMARTRKLIEDRKELHKRQFYTIEAEAQRLKEILTFISG